MSSQGSPDLSFGARVVDGILWRLGRVGIRITPFISNREGLGELDPVDIDGAFEFCELTEADIDDLVSLDPNHSAARLLEQFRQGKLCFGLRDGSRLVAKTWCDLDEVHSEVGPRKLNEGEAYLFTAYTDPEYRGRKLAPMLRSACCRELRRRRVSSFYSYSLYFNLPARRFKKKLGAVEEELKVHINLFQKWSRTLTIKTYRR